SASRSAWKCMCRSGPSAWWCRAPSPKASTTGPTAWSATWPGWAATRSTRCGSIPARSSRPACPACSWPRSTRRASTRKSSSAGTPTARRCWPHEAVLAARLDAVGAHPGGGAAVPVAGAVPAGAVPAGAQDQLRRAAVRHPALHGAGRVQGRGRAAQPAPARVHPAVHRQPLPGHLPEFAEDGGRHHGVLRADRLSHRVLHCALVAVDTQRAAAGGDPAVLDLAPAAGLCLGGHPAQRRPAQQAADGPGHHLEPAGNLPDRPGGVYRAGLCLPAVLHPAALRQPGEDGPAPAGSGLRSRRAALAGVLAHHGAAVAPRRDRRRHAGVHPVGGRIRHPGNAGRGRHPDDGPRHVERILQQRRLAHGLGRHVRDGAVAAGAPGAVPVQPGAPAGSPAKGARMKGPNKTARGLALGLGYFFLYAPILSLMVFSFNDSPLVTSWSGFSLRWYGSLLNDSALLSAAWLSFKIAALTATAAVVIGTWAGYVLGRMGRFRGFALYVG